MSIIYFLIPISLIVLAFTIVSFFWAIKNRQFDDLDSPAHKILFDDKEQRMNSNSCYINELPYLANLARKLLEKVLT